MIEFFRKLLNISGNTTGKPIYISKEKYFIPFFSDNGIQHEIADKGYSVQKLFHTDTVKRLKAFYAEFEKIHAKNIKDIFLASGRIADPALRSYVVNSIKQILDGELNLFFIPEAVTIYSGSLLIKPSSKNSALNPHQDSSLVDETSFFSVYAWIPLCNMNTNNGTLHVIEGSHLWDNPYRSLNIPWKYKTNTDLLKKHWKPLNVSEGDIVFFDSALIHGSTANKSDKNRIAVNSFIKPANTTLVHHYKENSATEIEEFEVDMDFFNLCDIMQRPPKRYKLLKKIPYKGVFPSNLKLKEMILHGLSG